MALRILLVDDHEVVRLGLKTLLARQPEFEIVDEAASASEAIEKTLRLKPDLVVMDIRLPGGSGIAACRAITAQQPTTRVLMLTSYAEDEMLFEAIAAGAAGYVLKQIGSAELVRALQVVGRGESLIDPALTQKVLARVRDGAHRRAESVFRKLSAHELKILALVAEGKTNREIAAQIFLSEKTVRNYVSSILAKLNLTSRAQAAAFAATHRLHDYLATEDQLS
ncbi:MAG: response regulator transcription factor [Chloroflexi bacterium]|nr:response regulator transcription factor [Chloroflexota bacterium]